MGILAGLFEKRFHPSQPPPEEWLLKLGLGASASGVEVTVDRSLQSTAVFACVRILAETVASLPLILYRRLDKGKKRAIGHPLYPLLHDLPNPEMTAVELRETLMGHLALRGNAFAEIEYDNGGRVRGLWPLSPNKTRVKRVNGQLVYLVTMPVGGEVGLPAERVMHLKGLGGDGIMGYSPIRLAREAIGLALATEEFGARFFGNGARPGVVLEHPGKLSPEAQDNLRKSWEMRHQGLEKSHRVAILEEGMKIETVGVSPEEAQFLETRKFQAVDIARLFHIPPHMIGELDRATFSNIEQQSLEFVIYTLRPWLVHWEQGINRALLTASERSVYFAEHLVDGLLRGDVQSRYQAYATGRQNGWLSANDIRELENMNPVDGGDVYLIPLNMVPADQVGGSSSQEVAGGGRSSAIDYRRLPDPEQRAQNLAKGRRRLARSYERLIKGTAERVVKREVADVRRALQKYLGKRDAFLFATWLKQFYQEHRQFWQRQMLPVLLSYADQVGMNVADELGGEPKTAEDIRAFIDQYAEALATREIGSSQSQLQALLDEALTVGVDPQPALETRLNEWEEKRPGKVAEHETFNALNALVLAMYGLYGITRKRWVSTGENCPYCSSLNGKVVELQKFFLGQGEDFQPDGAESPLNIRYNAGHPPIHGGCDCLILADR